MKLLLYCTKAKPYILKYNDGKYKEIASFYNKQDLATCDLLNGKIVGECDFEVEEIKELGGGEGLLFFTKTLDSLEIVKQACLKTEELADYLYKKYKDSKGYAIHIKNLHIFDKPINIRNYYNIAPRTMQDCINQRVLVKAPQNMCNAYDVYKNHYILISIKPEWLCKILNGEKTIEVRKKVLKEML